MAMNDFTKEELNDLIYCLNMADKQDIIMPSDKKCYFILNKIQSMIDNYCEHEWHPGGNRPWLHCIKCKANFDHEPYPN